MEYYLQEEHKVDALDVVNNLQGLIIKEYDGIIYHS